MSKLEKFYLLIGVCLTTYACIHEAHAATVLHVMVYNVQTADPTEHTVIAMPSREACEAMQPSWDGMRNAAGDRSEARCIEVIEVEVNHDRLS